jgi:hypothetical protein
MESSCEMTNADFLFADLFEDDLRRRLSHALLVVLKYGRSTFENY